MEIQTLLLADSTLLNLPKVKQGLSSLSTKVLDDLSIKTETTDADWMIAQTTDTEVKLLIRKIEQDLQNKTMPNLSGINLQDAIYLLESYGLKVVCVGYGAVVNQSIKKGELFKKGSVIKLELA